MIFSNTEGLPQPIVDAVTKDPYSRGGADFSVTQLISPPRKVALERKHDHEMVVDASDRLWALMGQIGHGILERSANAGIVEKRWFSHMNGFVISGQSDLVLAEQKLIDYKLTSVYTVKDGLKQEWEQQLNLLAWLAESHAQPIKEAQIIAIFRDWSVLASLRERDYPKRQVKVLPVTLWGFDKASEFCAHRVKLHADAMDGKLPECTAEERWEKAAVWAVMKKGRVRAVKLHSTEVEAVKHAAVEKGGYVQHRPGESVRCQSYCNAAPFCDQWKRLRGLQIEDDELPTAEAPVQLNTQGPAPVAPPAPQAPRPRRDEFLVGDDVATPVPIKPGEFPVDPDVTAGGIVNPLPPAKRGPQVSPAVQIPAGLAETDEQPVPADPNDPATPKPFVGREKPVAVQDAPAPEMPEVQ